MYFVLIEAMHEDEILLMRQHESSKEKSTLDGNIELIRVQRQLKEKANEVNILEARQVASLLLSFIDGAVVEKSELTIKHRFNTSFDLSLLISRCYIASSVLRVIKGGSLDASKKTTS